MFAFLISLATLGSGAFAAAWAIQAYFGADPSREFPKVMGLDLRYVIGGVLAVGSAFIAMIFPPAAPLLMGASGAAIGSAAADRAVQSGAGVGGV